MIVETRGLIFFLVSLTSLLPTLSRTPLPTERPSSLIRVARAGLSIAVAAKGGVR